MLLVVMLGVITFVGIIVALIMNTAYAGMTINGEPIGPVPVWEVLPIALTVFVLGWIAVNTVKKIIYWQTTSDDTGQ